MTPAERLALKRAHAAERADHGAHGAGLHVVPQTAGGDEGGKRKGKPEKKVKPKKVKKQKQQKQPTATIMQPALKVEVSFNPMPGGSGGALSQQQLASMTPVERRAYTGGEATHRFSPPDAVAPSAAAATPDASLLPWSAQGATHGDDLFAAEFNQAEQV